MDINKEEAIRDSIKNSDIRHKQRIHDIAAGFRGRHKNLIEFFINLENVFSNKYKINYNYLIYFPQFPKSSSEIVCIVSDGNGFELYPPVSHTGVSNKMNELDYLFSLNATKCSKCAMHSDNCRFYICDFRTSDYKNKKDVEIITNLLEEVIELDIPSADLFIKEIRIPPYSILGAMPDYKIFNGVFVLITKGKKTNSEYNEMCTIFQESFRFLLDKAEKNFAACQVVNYLEDLSITCLERGIKNPDIHNGETRKNENQIPRVFVASSVEGLKIAREVQSELAHDNISVEIWDQTEVFRLGTATIEALESAVNTYDFGIFIFTPDDELLTRGKIKTVPRDNVIFELGLFIGKLTRFRAFIVHSKEISVFSDFTGIKTAKYDSSSPNIRAALGPACEEIRKAISQDKH